MKSPENVRVVAHRETNKRTQNRNIHINYAMNSHVVQRTIRAVTDERDTNAEQLCQVTDNTMRSPCESLANHKHTETAVSRERFHRQAGAHNCTEIVIITIAQRHGDIRHRRTYVRRQRSRVRVTRDEYNKLHTLCFSLKWNLLCSYV